MDVSDEQLAPVRALFPACAGLAYFNVAATAPLPDPVARAIAAYVDGVQRAGTLAYGDWVRCADATRGLAAGLLGARPGEIAFVRNTSEGMNIVANGLPLGAGDSVVLIQGDFPANVHPWLRLRRKGVAVRFVKPDAEGRTPPAAILAAVDHSTRLVAASWVSFWNGYRLDIATLGAELRRRGVRLFVDAIQGLGALELPPLAAHVDFLAADAHKWLLGPEGIGLFYVRDELLELLEMTFVSWLSMADPYECERYEYRLLPDARRFEYATPNTLGIHALRAALALIADVGVPRIERHVLDLTDGIVAGLRARGLEVHSPRAGAERSGIVAFSVPGRATREVQAALAAAGVVVAARRDRLRLSAHLYNDAADARRFLAALDRIARPA